jgi:hypothetical protein
MGATKISARLRRPPPPAASHDVLDRSGRTWLHQINDGRQSDRAASSQMSAPPVASMNRAGLPSSFLSTGLSTRCGSRRSASLPAHVTRSWVAPLHADVSEAALAELRLESVRGGVREAADGETCRTCARRALTGSLAHILDLLAEDDRLMFMRVNSKAPTSCAHH